jgi:hypothetical protein
LKTQKQNKKQKKRSASPQLSPTIILVPRLFFFERKRRERKRREEKRREEKRREGKERKENERGKEVR